jgi:hypothetical protein
MKKKSKIRLGVLSTALSAAVTCPASQQPEKAGQELPNVILIFLDDMGYGDLSLTGVTGYKTPHIDRMANVRDSSSRTITHRRQCQVPLVPVCLQGVTRTV